MSALTSWIPELGPTPSPTPHCLVAILPCRVGSGSAPSLALGPLPVLSTHKGPDPLDGDSPFPPRQGLYGFWLRGRWF